MSMNPKNVEDLINTYTQYLEELVDRLWVIIWITQEMDKKEIINQFSYVDAEVCVLQLRKSLEIVGYMCLLAHRPMIGKFSTRLTKLYRPTEIIKEIRTKNTRYFPTATSLQDSRGEKKFIEVTSTAHGIPLSETDFLKAYTKLSGPRMHASNTFKHRSPEEIHNDTKYIRSIALDLMALLGVHKIHVGDHYIIYAGMKSSDTGKPFASFFTRQNA